MNTIALGQAFENISQRVVVSYLDHLADLQVVLPASAPPGLEQSERDLHAFFEAFYTRLFNDPASFGLPLDEDAYVMSDRHGTNEKAEITKKVKKARDLMELGMGFLMQAGVKGRLRGGELLLDEAVVNDYAGKSKAKKQFLKGLEAVGLAIMPEGEGVVLRSERFPAMMPAFKMLAEACAPQGRTGELNFGRCDFRALNPGYEPEAMDLYRVFNPADFQRVAELHAYLAQLNYKPVYQYYGMSGWEVKYQGSRAKKGTPLVQIEYSERYLNQLRIFIKCAASNRIIPLLADRPLFLQEDFNRRANHCNGDKCNWCANKKSLGPTEWTFKGETRTICWYTNPDIHVVDDTTVDLVKEYVSLHEALG